MNESKIQDLSVLDSQIQKRVQAFQTSLREEKNRPQKASPCITRPSDSTKCVVGMNYLSRKYKDLLGYLILLHFFDFDEKHHCYCKIDLEEQLAENGQFFFLSTLVESKTFLLKFLSEQTYISDNVLFGTILSYENLRRLAYSIIIRFEETFPTPRRTIRRRGYKDKGSLPELSTSIRRHEESVDFSLRELQELIENERLVRIQKTRSFRDWLDGCRTLTEEELLEFRILRNNKNKEEQYYVQVTVQQNTGIT